jgi:hypothetical protein
MPSKKPSKLDDPAWRAERARKASAAANTPEAAINRLARHVNDMTPDQKARVRELVAS